MSTICILTKRTVHTDFTNVFSLVHTQVFPNDSILKELRFAYGLFDLKSMCLFVWLVEYTNVVLLKYCVNMNVMLRRIYARFVIERSLSLSVVGAPSSNETYINYLTARHKWTKQIQGQWKLYAFQMYASGHRNQFVYDIWNFVTNNTMR